jgi:hypothetical protein
MAKGHPQVVIRKPGHTVGWVHEPYPSGAERRIRTREIRHDIIDNPDSRRGRGKLVEESFRQIQSLDQEMPEVVLVGACHFSSQLRQVGAQEIPQDDGLFSGKD